MFTNTLSFVFVHFSFISLFALDALFLFYPWLKVTHCIYVFMVSPLKLRSLVTGISHSDFLSLTASQLLLTGPRGAWCGVGAPRPGAPCDRLGQPQDMLQSSDLGSS